MPHPRNILLCLPGKMSLDLNSAASSLDDLNLNLARNKETLMAKFQSQQDLVLGTAFSSIPAFQMYQLG